MSTTGVCPYCGKTFKRLKGHLPHCKAKELSEPSQTQHDRTASKETLSKPPTSSTATSFSSDKATKSTPSKESPTKSLLSTKNDKDSRLDSLPPSTPLKTEYNQSLLLMPSPVRSPAPSVSQPTSSKKKTQSLAHQNKMAALTSSISPSAPLPSPSKPSNTSSALKQTATSKQVTKGPLKQAQSKPQPIQSDKPPAAFRPLADTVNSAALLSTRRQEAGEKHPARLAPETHLRGASKTKEMSGRSPLTTQMSGPSNERIPLDGVPGTAQSPTEFWEDGGLQNVDRAHSRATLQNVKDTLRRSKGIGQPGKLSLLDHIQSPLTTRDWQPVETKVRGPLDVSQDQTGIQAPLGNANGIGPLLTSTSPSNQLPDTSPQGRQLSPVERLAAFPPEKEVFIPAGTTYLSPPALQGPALQSSPPSTAGLIQRYEMALLPTSSSVTRPVEATQARANSSAPTQCPSGPLNLSVDKESGGVTGRIRTKDPEVIIRNLKLKNAIEGNLAGRRLGQVRLGELPLWLAINAPSRPRGAVEALHRGWRWYYRRYIDVRKGGIGGVSMLLAGYCVLSYVWSYPHIKSDRWRKYH
ncbi:flocculation protein FLO11 [Gadus morhua]|uniref:ATP synthase subunit f, mitochondrial n=1 Tax=Gadus morhua TaxID=8049 RepID=A0A8C5CR17_GADMO|nr:ATP synthase subunit f, mitochondrial [Gadus morhua]